MQNIDRAGFGSGHQPSFQELFREIGCAESECNRSGQHDSSPSYAESHDDDVLGNAELLQRHGAREDLEPGDAP